MQRFSVAKYQSTSTHADDSKFKLLNGTQNFFRKLCRVQYFSVIWLAESLLNLHQKQALSCLLNQKLCANRFNLAIPEKERSGKIL